MEQINFKKMSGAGNDFIIFEETQLSQIELSEVLIKKLCDRRSGIGADGLITLAQSPDLDFEMHYYNADGSTGSLCGNGARCAIKYSVDAGWNSGDQLNFISNGKEYSGKLLTDGNVQFNLNPPSKIKYNFKVKASNQLINASYADTGSPHVVININDILTHPGKLNSSFTSLDNFPVEDIGREIRNLPEFLPGGVNVNFVDIQDKIVDLRTYERGVESETYACGTGAVASALICFVANKLEKPIEVKVKSNQKLLVNFDIKDQRVSNLTLTGPANFIFSGTIPKLFFE